jgi:hypothetical protein
MPDSNGHAAPDASGFDDLVARPFALWSEKQPRMGQEPPALGPEVRDLVFLTPTNRGEIER